MSWAEKTREGEKGGEECDGRWIGEEDGVGILGFWLWIVGCGLGKWFGRAFREMLILWICSPLRPSSCQSVRMDFLAVSPGVHSIDTLILTDVETGFAMNLR